MKSLPKRLPSMKGAPSLNWSLGTEERVPRANLRAGRNACHDAGTVATSASNQFVQPQLDRYSSVGRGSSSLILPSAKSDAVMVTPAGSSPIALPSPSNWPSSNRSVPNQR